MGGQFELFLWSWGFKQYFLWHYCLKKVDKTLLPNRQQISLQNTFLIEEYHSRTGQVLEQCRFQEETNLSPIWGNEKPCLWYVSKVRWLFLSKCWAWCIGCWLSWRYCWYLWHPATVLDITFHHIPTILPSDIDPLTPQSKNLATLGQYMTLKSQIQIQGGLP